MNVFQNDQKMIKVIDQNDQGIVPNFVGFMDKNYVKNAHLEG